MSYYIRKMELRSSSKEDLVSTASEPKDIKTFLMTSVCILEKYIFGNLPDISTYLEDKPLPLKILNYLLRALGTPIFMNNPLSGIVIAVALFVHEPWSAVMGLLSLFMAIITALLLSQEPGDIESGGATFNSLLVGLVITGTSAKEKWYPMFILPVVVLGIITVFVASGLNSIFGTFNLPSFNFPFNVVALAFVAAVGENNAFYPTQSFYPGASNGTMEWNGEDIVLLLTGVLHSPSQVYGTVSTVSSFLLYVALFIASPIVCVHSFLGALVGCITAAVLGVPISDIATGAWSFNSMLCCGCLGGFFYVLTIHSHFLAIMSAVYACVVFGALSNVLGKVDLPCMALPFVFTASLFLSFNSKSRHFIKMDLSKITYPEQHRRQFKVNAINDDSTADESLPN